MKISKLIGSCAIILTLAVCGAVAFADTEVAINETNFPDEYLRKYVEDHDRDGDKTLSQKELDSIKSINLYTSSCKDLKGLELLTSINYLYININRITIHNC